MSFGDRLKQAREMRGMSRDDLAAQIGVSRSGVSNYENEISHPSVDKIRKMIEVLGVDANYLWQDTIKKSSPAEAEEDALKSRLDTNYNKMNDTGRQALVAHSALLLKDSANLAKPKKIVTRPWAVKSNTDVTRAPGDTVYAPMIAMGGDEDVRNYSVEQMAEFRRLLHENQAAADEENRRLFGRPNKE